MKVAIVGMGIQGVKRKKFLGSDFACSVDKFKNSDYSSIQKVPLKDYNAVFICLPDKEKLKLVAALLQVAGEEYAIAVVNGKMENAHEYQDALGFTTIARSIISQLDANTDSHQHAATLVDSIKPLWPTLIPPSTLDTDAGEIYGVAAKVELLALSL